MGEGKNYLNDGIINSKPQITHRKLSFKTKFIKGANLLMQSIIRYFDFNIFKIMLR